MSETKWTPGPWAYDGCNVVDSAGGVVATSGLALAHGYVPVDDVTRYNDRLIAAAPDLYEALSLYFRKGHHDTCSHQLCDECKCDCGWEMAESALSKARGEL